MWSGVKGLVDKSRNTLSYNIIHWFREIVSDPLTQGNSIRKEVQLLKFPLSKGLTLAYFYVYQIRSAIHILLEFQQFIFSFGKYFKMGNK